MTEEMNSRLEKLLNDTKSVSARDPQAAARGRAKFLREAAQMSASVSAAQKLPVLGNRRYVGKGKACFSQLPGYRGIEAPHDAFTIAFWKRLMGAVSEYGK